jgi:hypothetical protein
MQRLAVPLAYGYGKARSAVASSGSLVNLYTEQTPMGAKGDLMLVGVPGTRARAQLTYVNVEEETRNEGAIHAALPAFGGILAVADNGTYLIAEDFTWQRIGAGLTGPVSLTWNGIDAVATNGTTGVWITDDDVETIVDVDFYPSSSAAVLDGYLIFARDGTGQIFCTEPFSRDLQGLSFATAVAEPDDVVAVAASRTELIVMGETATEFWYRLDPPPSTGFPFSRVPGGVIGFGCASAASVATYDGTTWWLTPKGAVVQVAGLQPQVVSDAQIEAALVEVQFTFLSDGTRVENWAAARAFAYEQRGHVFYCLTVGGRTLVYDVTMREWHERRNYSRGHHLARAYAFQWGKHFVFDDAGRMLELSPDFHDDAGEPLVAEVVSLPYHADREYLSVDAIELQVDPGVSPLTGEHVWLMAMSRDQGRTWSQERPAGIGRTGAYRHKLVWRRCGAAEDVRFRFRTSDPSRRGVLSTAMMETA